VTIKIYVEGGGNNNSATKAKCKEAFAEYCKKLCPADRRPRIVVCGSRNEAFKKFKTATSLADGEQCALLVDSEGYVRPESTPASHLSNQDKWNFEKQSGQHVFLMVQAMEAWFFADRIALAAYYEAGFHANALRGSERNVEEIRKTDLEQSLKDASKGTTKGPYHKTRHGFDLLRLINPDKVAAGSSHAAAFHRFLKGENLGD